MQTQRDNALSERGGVPLRDYTQDGRELRRFSSKRINFDQIGHTLVLVSLGIGLAELLMPKRIQKLVGVRKGDYSLLIRAAGLREILHAVLIYWQPRPRLGVWSRVFGDAMDLGLMGAAFSTPRVKKNRAGVAAASLAGVAAIDALTAVQLNRRKSQTETISAMTQDDLNTRIRSRHGAFRVMRSVTINRPANELYSFWRDFSNLPNFMYHLQDVRVIDNRRSHWVTKAPAGRSVEWDAEITEDRPNEMIAWQSTKDAEVENSGAVRFEPAPGGRGTVVRVQIDYRPPGGAAGRVIAFMFGEDPMQQLAADLARFKQLMETGEVIRSDGAPAGFGQKMQRPAQPMKQAGVDLDLSIPMQREPVTADNFSQRGG